MKIMLTKADILEMICDKVGIEKKYDGGEIQGHDIYWQGNPERKDNENSADER